MSPADAAVRAAVDCARELGLTCTAPRVLADGLNTVVHLAPAPVVARVATRTPLLRPDVEVQFRREVDLATALTDAGAAVVGPSDLLPPGPHRRDGLVLSFWQHVELTGVAPSATEVGRAVGDLHGVLCELRPPAGTLLDTPLDDLEVFLSTGRALGSDPTLVEQVGALLAAVRPRLTGQLGALHGDAHPGNLLGTPTGWRWTDLEDTSPGPLAWDLACLRSTSRLDGRAAVDATPFPLTDDELRPFLQLRRLHGAAWNQAYATDHPAARAAADTLLADAVEEVSRQLAG